jgi:hypothetical protein
LQLVEDGIGDIGCQAEQSSGQADCETKPRHFPVLSPNSYRERRETIRSFRQLRCHHGSPNCRVSEPLLEPDLAQPRAVVWHKHPLAEHGAEVT